ncbi:MAG: quinoprotein dehydrogenase-associated SoxYZ-like carrier, partial [Rhizobiales bacterium]|nr:quinoprotein dehydrogenase-associated SoxYZ-like carrier [Hyphomicrobiales bacterium]
MGWLRMTKGVLALAMLGVLAGSAGPVLAADDDPWPDIRAALFEDREILDGSGVIRLQAPERAEDAAVVPIKVTADIPQTEERYIEKIHLVIDRNPAPVAGVFHLTPASGIATIATRVRVNEYTHVRAVAETSDGALYMATAFVKASGGCSAPALKDHEVAMARLGRIKVKEITPFTAGEPNQVQLMISHPNYSGLQIDQVSRNWVPPHFVESIDIRYGARTIMTVEGDISLSENPSVRFSFVPEGPGARGGQGGGHRGPGVRDDQAMGPAPGVSARD